MYDDIFWHEQLSAINKTGDLLLQTWRFNSNPIAHIDYLNDQVEDAKGEVGVGSLGDSDVIDFGCGTGQTLFLLDILFNERSTFQYYGINLHNAATWEKNALNYGSNVHLYIGDITDPAVLTKNSLAEKKFGAAMCNYTLGHLSYPGMKTFLRTAFRCLQDSGIFVMWDIAPASHAFDQILGYNLRHPSEVVRELKEAGFTNIERRVYSNAVIAESAEAVMSKADLDAFKTRTIPVLYMAEKPTVLYTTGAPNGEGKEWTN